ncbi:pilus assembly protein N-terminal domain-containing protein [Ensifer canadensis]
MILPFAANRTATLTLAIFGMLSLLAVPVNAQDNMMRVHMDHARVLKLDRPVSKVIIGNAEVADATVADARTIVITGRSFGTTNLVILDQDGNAIVDEQILVSIDEANTVRVYRQTSRTVLSCTPSCERHVERKTASSGN